MGSKYLQLCIHEPSVAAEEIERLEREVEILHRVLDQTDELARSRFEQYRTALKHQAVVTAFYNGHGNARDIDAKWPDGTLLWKRYLCDEAKKVMGE